MNKERIAELRKKHLEEYGGLYVVKYGSVSELAALVPQLLDAIEALQLAYDKRQGHLVDCQHERDALKAEVERYRAALENISKHDMSQRQPCDYHCAWQMVLTAREAIAEADKE